MNVAVLKGVTTVLGAVLLTGCTSMGVRDHRGAVIDKELASAIQVGVDNKDSVTKTLGRSFKVAKACASACPAHIEATRPRRK